jgi:hypothetical protein
MFSLFLTSLLFVSQVTKSAIRQLMTYGLAPKSLGHTSYEIPESDMVDSILSSSDDLFLELLLFFFVGGSALWSNYSAADR